MRACQKMERASIHGAWQKIIHFPPCLLLLCLCLGMLLTACRQEHATPYERMLLFSESDSFSLPAGRLYRVPSELHEEGYMPPALAETLYGLRGYSELRHAEGYALYLSARSDRFFEAAIFLAVDAVGVSEIVEMCRTRGDYLTQSRAIEDGCCTVSVSGRYVAAIYGAHEGEGRRMASFLLHGGQ